MKSVFLSMLNICIFINIYSVNITAQIDTIFLKNKIPFNSNLNDIIINCVDEKFQYKPLTKDNLLGLQDILNKELKTKAFKLLQVVTGASIKLKNSNINFYLMEWHFSSPNTIDKIERYLNRLKDGMIYNTVAPYACKWVKGSQKLYIITYIPNNDSSYIINNIYDCIIIHNN